jgi:hypothetical protein
MAEPQKEPTKSELAEALLRANMLMAEQAKAIEELRAEKPQSSSDEVQLEILQLLKELRGSKPQSQHYNGPEIKKTAYDGYVRAIESCVVNVLFQDGDFHPVRYEKGDVFQVDVDQLWTDDPYEPVTLKGNDDSGKPVTVGNESAVRADFRFRRHTSVVEDPTLKRASQY